MFTAHRAAKISNIRDYTWRVSLIIDLIQVRRITRPHNKMRAEDLEDIGNRREDEERKKKQKR